MLDSLGVEVFTIEMQLGSDIVKADIMREPVAFTKIVADRILQPSEALASSLNFYGKVEMDYIMRSTGLSDEDVIAALQGEIYYNPLTEEWEHKGRFLAGNVVDKYKELTSCLDDLSGRERDWAEISARALENATPELIPYEELDINMGERWIDPQLYADFAADLFGVEAEVMYFDVNDTYVVRLKGYSPAAYNTYSVRNFNGEDLFVHALHDTVPEITKEVYRMVIRYVCPTRKPFRKRLPRYRKSAAISTSGSMPVLWKSGMNWYAHTTSVSTAMFVLPMTARHRPFRSFPLSSSRTMNSTRRRKTQSG